MGNPEDIGKVIKELLDSDQEVDKLIGGRIYPVVALEPDTPCVIYATNISPANTKDGPAYCKIEVSVNVVTKNPKEMASLSTVVRKAIAGKSGTIAGEDIKGITWTGTRDINFDGAFVREIGFIIRMKQL